MSGVSNWSKSGYKGGTWFLVVLAGEVLWFDLAPLTSSAGERAGSAV